MGENEVRALYDKLVAAWNDHDGDAMAEPFAADGVVIGFDGSVSFGTETIGTDMSNVFADHETGRYAVKVQSVQPLKTQAMILRAIAGLVPPGRTAINRKRTPTRQSSLKNSTANGRLCCSKTLPLNSTAVLAWSRT